jgi:hypothetical protein
VVVYGQCGLRLRSELPLDLPTLDGDGYDVEVVEGPSAPDTSCEPPGVLVAERLAPDGADWWYRATETDDGYLLRFRGAGDVVVTADLDRAEVRADRGGRHEVLPVLLAGTVSAFLLSLRGATVLHASSVAVNGSALAFVAPSGWGKTTLATLLCLDGAMFVSDDVLTVEPGPPPTCVGGATELRLRQGAAALAAVDPAATSRATSDERLAVTFGRAVDGAVPLSAIVLPAPSRAASTVDAVRLAPPDALMRLLGLLRVEGWSRTDVLQRDFRRLGDLVNVVPVYAAVVPWGPPFPPSVAPDLAALVTRPT